jgi:uncharacterized membrane protein YeaQ/YmgE (transglycosylase-associated protein family)
MGDPEIGWIAAIIIGGIVGWLAEQFMKSDMGLLMNIVLGIVGAAIASAIFSFFGVVLAGWIGYLIAGFIGARLLIWIVRAVRGRTQRDDARRRNRVCGVPVKCIDELRSSSFRRRSAPLKTIRRSARRGALSVLHDAGRLDILQARGEGMKPTLKGLGGCEMSSFRARCSAD